MGPPGRGGGRRLHHNRRGRRGKKLPRRTAPPTAVAESFRPGGVGERTRARVFLDAYARSRSNELGRVDARLLREEHFAQANLRRVQDLIEQEQARPPQRRDADRVGRLQQEQRDAEQRLGGVIARMERQSPEYAALRYPRPCPLQQAWDALDDREVVVLTEHPPGPGGRLAPACCDAT
jgi:hypothetical protein